MLLQTCLFSVVFLCYRRYRICCRRTICSKRSGKYKISLYSWWLSERQILPILCPTLKGNEYPFHTITKSSRHPQLAKRILCWYCDQTHIGQANSGEIVKKKGTSNRSKKGGSMVTTGATCRRNVSYRQQITTNEIPWVKISDVSWDLFLKKVYAKRFS